MEPVLYEARDGIATLTLNLPHKLNPIATELQVALRAALGRAREDNSVRQAIEASPPADELLTALSPLLDEVDGLRGNETPREAGNIPVLLEENARLRKLAVKLSNLLGDLPERGT